MPRVQQARPPRASGGGTLSAVELVRTPEERFDDLPGISRSTRATSTLPDGLRMHYVDEGPAGRRDGAPPARPADVVLPVPHGRARGWPSRACAPWRPTSIGFGRSDKPVGAHGLFGAGARRLAGAVRRRRSGSRDVTLVVQDWGGPIGLGLLGAAPGLVRRVVAANTVLHTADPALAGRLAWAVPRRRPDGTVTVEQMLLDYQRLTQELTPFRPEPLRAGGHRVGGAGRRPGGLRRAVPRRGLLRRARASCPC